VCRILRRQNSNPFSPWCAFFCELLFAQAKKSGNYRSIRKARREKCFSIHKSTCAKAELLRGAALDLFEAFYEISDVVEAATEGDLSHRHITSEEHICRLLNAVKGEVVYRCLTGMGMEKTAEIIFIHTDYFGERRELYLL